MTYRFRIGRWLTVLSFGAALTACATQPPRSAIVKESRCTDFSFPVYFRDGADRLTLAADQAIAESATRIKSCSVASLTIVGLTGGAAPEDLIARRSDAIAKALAANGLTGPTPVVDVGARTAPSDLATRRIEVVVRFNPAR